MLNLLLHLGPLAEILNTYWFDLKVNECYLTKTIIFINLNTFTQVYINIYFEFNKLITK